MNNKKLGSEFEREFEKLLKDNGYWVHFCAPSSTGSQPCDFIAVKNGEAYLIDCKTCVNNYFTLRRMEQNQIQAFNRWRICSNRNMYVAVKHNDKVYMISYVLLAGQKTVNLTNDLLFENWR